ncbi:inositol monophosphatase family protein [Brevibacterium sp.]|uniref:inositol monophosphatase family protein n=1 Tax=Brevibacterium sp. TaxID=1701 RepID=UPI0025BEB3CB|nr:inositol monophosphatase family protein [Brevibacterium sp.]
MAALHDDPLLDAARQSAVIAVHRMRHWSRELTAAAVDSKDGRNNLVTLADAEIEALVRGRLLRLRPEDVVVGEENSASVRLEDHESGGELTALLTGAFERAPESGVPEDAGAVGARTHEWHVDPIDGTVNFVRGIEHYCFSVGVRALPEAVPGAAPASGAALLTGADQPAAADGAADADAGWVAGLVAAPALDRVWFARAGSAWTAPLTALTDPAVEAVPLTGASAPTSGRVVATGFGYSRERRAQQLASLGAVMEEFDDLRRCGSAALDLCMVAEGRVNAYYERGLGIYDFAGGAYIAECAGRWVRRRPDAFGAGAGGVRGGSASPASGAEPVGAPELTVAADSRERLEFLLRTG